MAVATVATSKLKVQAHLRVAEAHVREGSRLKTGQLGADRVDARQQAGNVVGSGFIRDCRGDNACRRVGRGDADARHQRVRAI